MVEIATAPPTPKGAFSHTSGPIENPEMMWLPPLGGQGVTRHFFESFEKPEN